LATIREKSSAWEEMINDRVIDADMAIHDFRLGGLGIWSIGGDPGWTSNL
jgi:hypothetical protein